MTTGPVVKATVSVSGKSGMEGNPEVSAKRWRGDHRKWHSGDGRKTQMTKGGSNLIALSFLSGNRRHACNYNECVLETYDCL